MASSGLLVHVDKCVEVVLDDRSPGATEQYEAISDVDGQLEDMVGPLRALFLLIRPDRVIAAAFLPSAVAEVMTAFETFLSDGSPPVADKLLFTPNERAV